MPLFALPDPQDLADVIADRLDALCDAPLSAEIRAQVIDNCIAPAMLMIRAGEMVCAAGELERRRVLVDDQCGEQDRADRLQREQDRADDGGKPRQRARDQQPADDLGREREQDQPSLRRPRRREVEVSDHCADHCAPNRGAQRRVEERTGGTAEIATPFPERQEEPGVRNGGQNAVDSAGLRVCAVRVVFERA